MPILFSEVDCAQQGDVVENLNAITGHITATVVVRCTWENRLYLADDVLLNRRRYPLIHTAFAPIAMTVSINNGDSWKDAVTDGQFRQPKTSLVTINYGIPDTAATTNYDVVSESLDPIGEFSKLNHSQFRFGSQAGLPLLGEEAPSLLNVKLRLNRKIYRLPTIPPATLSSFGKVNQARYVSPILGLTFEPETLLYDAPQPERTLSDTGEEGFNLTQNFVYAPNGWNKYFNPLTNEWEYIYHVNSPLPFKSYVPADFSEII